MLGSYGINEISNGETTSGATPNGGNAKLGVREWIFIFGGILTFQMIIEAVKPELRKRRKK